MKSISQIIIVFALLCVSAAAAYSQDCTGYLKRASELVSQKKYCEAKVYYQRYGNCNADADVRTEIAICEKYCKINVMEGIEVETVGKTEQYNPTQTSVPPARDIITLKTGEDIQASVLEIGDIDIKYKKYDNLNGPSYILKKSEIFMIRYANGDKDVFADLSKPTPAKTNTQSREELPVNYQQTSTTEKSPGNPYKFRMYIGMGSGHSYGVLGTSLEARFNSFGIHTGVGYYPDLEEPSWAAGAKLYFGKI